MKLRHAAILLLGALSCATAGAAQTPETYDLWLNADITIDQSGRMTALEWTDTQPGRQLVAGRITPNVQAWEFVPAMVNGQPMETRTGLKVRMQVTESADGSVALEVADARTGPRTIGLKPPAYPREAAVAGVDATVMVVIEVGPDGEQVVLDMKFDSSSGSTGRRSHRKAFLAATEAAVLDWTFQPEIVAGRAVRTRMRVPVDFCVSQRCAWQESLKEHRSGLPSNMPIALDSAVSFKSDFRAAIIP